jgi:DNA-binding transcriptional ArsR family regulator
LQEAFKALSDPTRRRILELLKERDLTAGEIAEQFQMAQPSVSRHLNVLRQAGLVWTEKNGQFVTYSLNATAFQSLLIWLAQLRNSDTPS